MNFPDFYICINHSFLHTISAKGGSVMNITPELYDQMSKKASPKTNSRVNVATAFCVGGLICVAGEIIRTVMESYVSDTAAAAMWTSIILISLILATGVVTPPVVMSVCPVVVFCDTVASAPCFCH